MAFSSTKIGIKFIKEKYGVDLDLSHYLKQTKKLAPNGVLIGMFREAYKQIHLKDTLDMTGESSKCAEFFKDFNYHVVLSLREEAPLKRLNVPDRGFGFSPKEQYDFIKRLNDNGPKNNIEAVMMNYEKGNIRIRDMKHFATHINEFGGLKNEKNRIILATYAEALKRYNASRTTGSRWRHPWRSNAETRDAKIIEDILKNGVGDRLYNEALNSARTTLFAGDRIEKACLKETLNVEKIDDYVEPDPNAPKLEDWEFKQAEWQRILEDQKKQDEEMERARKEELLKQQEKEKQDAIQREKEKENIKKQREEEKRLKEERIKNNPDAAKTPEEIAKEAQDEINNFLAELNAGIAQRKKEREELDNPIKISIDDVKEDIYQNSEQNPKIDPPQHQAQSLEK